MRARILAATADLLSGGTPVSIGSVAQAAGVTKGAVQHHFGTREALLQALWDGTQTQFEQVLAREAARHGTSASGAEAYLRAAVRVGTQRPSTRQWRAILAAAVSERPLARQWRDWVAAGRRANAEGTHELVMRLAADGLWLSDLLGLYRLSAQERADLQDALLARATPASVTTSTPAPSKTP